MACMNNAEKLFVCKLSAMCKAQACQVRPSALSYQNEMSEHFWTILSHSCKLVAWGTVLRFPVRWYACQRCGRTVLFVQDDTETVPSDAKVRKGPLRERFKEGTRGGVKDRHLRRVIVLGAVPCSHLPCPRSSRCSPCIVICPARLKMPQVA